MCACRCGIKVHLRDGQIRYIEGNRDHPVNRGVLCAKGSAGIMQHYSPARLTQPAEADRRARRRRIPGDLLGRGARHRERMARQDPRRRSAQARLLHRPRPEPGADRLVGAASSARRTMRRMAASARSTWRPPGIYTIGGSFWEFGEPDWDRTPLFHAVRRAPRTTTATRSRSGSASSRRAAPRSSRSTRCAPATRRSPTSGSASRPAPTACSCSRWSTSCLRAGMVDVDYLARYTNAGWLVVAEPGAAGLRPVPARCRGPAAVLGPQAAGAAPGRRWRRPAEPQGRGAHRPRPARPCRCSSCWPSAISIARYSPDAVATADRHSRRHDPADRRRAGACGVRARPSRLDVPWTDAWGTRATSA